jgi:hypothetical protein
MFRMNPSFTFAAVTTWVLGIGSPPRGQAG